MIRTISIPELYSKYQSLEKEELILDVRTPQEFAEGHIPGSRNISHEHVGMYAQELKAYKNLYVYCRSGGRVQFACHELMQHGLNNLVALVDGGMPNWIEDGFPVEK